MGRLTTKRSRSPDGKEKYDMTEKEKILATLRFLGLELEYKSGLYYDEVLVYNSDEYLGSLAFVGDELVIDWL